MTIACPPKNLKLLFFLSVFLLAPFLLRAQSYIDNVPATSFAGSGGAYLSGLPAIDVNVGRLHVFETPRQPMALTVSAFPLGFNIENNSVDVDLYNELFGKDSRKLLPGGEKTEWSESDKTKFLSNVEDIFELNSNINYSLLGFSYFFDPLNTTFAFSINDKSGTRGKINKDLFVLGLTGNESFFNNTISLNDTKFAAWWYREYGISAATEITDYVPVGVRRFAHLYDIMGGATIKFITPYAYIDGDGSGTDLFFSANGDSISGSGKYSFRQAYNSAVDDNGSFFPFPSSAGFGMGLNLGISAKISDRLDVSLALNDFGVVSFSDNSETRSRDGSIDFGGFDEILDSDRVQAQADSLEAIFDESITKENFSVWLPTHLRASGAMRFDSPFQYIVMLDWIQGFNDNFGNTTIPIVALGAELRFLETVPLRTGFRVGGENGFGWSLGTGLVYPNFSLEFGFKNFTDVFAMGSAKSLSFSFNLRARFMPVYNVFTEL
jgi:hypothetical protein